MTHVYAEAVKNLKSAAGKVNRDKNVGAIQELPPINLNIKLNLVLFFIKII